MDDLRSLRLNKQIPAKEMVDVVQAIYPKYDKTVQSKCENGDAYGVCLRKDAMKALYTKFAPEMLKVKKEQHRLKCRISCRLEDSDFALLQQNIKADGYATMQDFLTDMVRRYNKQKEGDKNV